MSLFSNISAVLAIYTTYQLLTKKEYEDFRNVIKKSYEKIKPSLLELLDSFEFYAIGADHVKTTEKKIKLSDQINIIKNVIESIDTKKIATSAIDLQKKANK